MDRILESHEQIVVISRCRHWSWLRTKEGKLDHGVGSIFHIPNGGFRSKSEAARLKAMGVKAGVADLFLPVPVRYEAKWPGGEPLWVHGLWIEMKQQLGPRGGGGGRLSDDQLMFGQAMQLRGYEWVACHGAKEALQAIERYLGIPGQGLSDLDAPAGQDGPAAG